MDMVMYKEKISEESFGKKKMVNTGLLLREAI